MRSCNIGDKLALQQVKEGPAKEAWIKEQMKFEIDRLKAILRDGLATDEEHSIAQSQIANYQGDGRDDRLASPWLAPANGSPS